MKPKAVCNNRMKNPTPPPALKHSHRNQTLMCAPRSINSKFPKCPLLCNTLLYGEIQTESCLRHDFIEVEKPSVLNTPCCCRGRLLTGTEWCCEETKILQMTSSSTPAPLCLHSEKQISLLQRHLDLSAHLSVLMNMFSSILVLVN